MSRLYVVPLMVRMILPLVTPFMVPLVMPFAVLWVVPLVAPLGTVQLEVQICTIYLTKDGQIMNERLESCQDGFVSSPRP